MTETMNEVRPAVQQICAEAQVRAALHAVDLDSGAQVEIGADDRCVTASTYKVIVLLELACQAAAGELKLTDRVRIGAGEHAPGISGISSMLDDIELSLRDAALQMIQVSDNTATDVLQGIVGTDRIMQRLQALGLTNTVIRQDCAGLIRELLIDFGCDPDGQDIDLSPAELAAAVERSPALAGETGNTTTARDMTSLLRMIWADEAGPAEACEEVRRVLLRQYAPHRLSTAYNDGPSIAGKTGTFTGGVRNEVGVFDFGDGERYAVAIYLRQNGTELRDSRADRALGKIARTAVDHLRALRSAVG